MSVCIRLLAAALAFAAGLTASVCIPLHSGDSVKASTSRKVQACFLVDVAQGEATQLIAEQPRDLEIDLASGESRIVYDGFDFGPETASIPTAGCLSGCRTSGRVWNFIRLFHYVAQTALITGGGDLAR